MYEFFQDCLVKLQFLLGCAISIKHLEESTLHSILFLPLLSINGYSRQKTTYIIVSNTWLYRFSKCILMRLDNCANITEETKNASLCTGSTMFDLQVASDINWVKFPNFWRAYRPQVTMRGVFRILIMCQPLRRSLCVASFRTLARRSTQCHPLQNFFPCSLCCTLPEWQQKLK